MMQELLNHARRVASEVAGLRAATRHGTIDGYDPANYAVRIKLQPDGTLTDWIPLKTAWAGASWGLFLAPSIGDAVELDFQEADGGVASAGWRFFNDGQRPLPVPGGEAWIVHASGASIRLTNDGKLTLADGHGASFALNGDGTIASAGTWTHRGSFSANGIDLATHRHGGVTAGSGNSAGPVA